MRQESELISSIEKIIENGKKIGTDTQFSLENLQELEWNKLYIFAPYTPTYDIEQKIGVSNSTVKEIDIESRDDINLLVFMMQNTVTVAVPYPRKKGDFSQAVSDSPIFKGKTFFRLVESADEKGWFYVQLAR